MSNNFLMKKKIKSFLNFDTTEIVNFYKISKISSKISSLMKNVKTTNSTPFEEIFYFKHAQF